MAERGYEDIKQKGRKLWEALKSDPVNHDYIRDLLYEEGAPPNFREPGCEVRKVLIENCIPFISRWNI